MEDPPLAQHFSLFGVSPHLPVQPSDATPHGNWTFGKCVGRVVSQQPQMWPVVVMNILKMVTGHRGNRDEVEVHVDVRPGDEIVIYCRTSEGEVE